MYVFFNDLMMHLKVSKDIVCLKKHVVRTDVRIVASMDRQFSKGI